MKSTAFAGLVLGAALLPQPAAAEVIYPFCAVRQGGPNAYENCGYPTWAACQASVSGVGGYCMENPRYVYSREAEPPRRKRVTR